MTPDSHDLVEPFEWVTDVGPVKGRITRPVVRAFQHVVLPEALFTWHPLLAAVLRDQPTLPPPFNHMWSKAGIFCEQRRLTQPGSTKGTEGFWDYVTPMATSIQISTADTEAYAVWILTMPFAKAPTDCHFAALCKPKDESDAHLLLERSTRSHYFTLESTGQPGSAFFCTWQPTGQHGNFGGHEDLGLEHFKTLVTARLPG